MSDEEFIQVEVNEENIIRFNLVQLTGNTTEQMLVAAREALLSGHTLTCKIPKPEGYEPEVVVNAFDAANAQPSFEAEDDIPEYEASIMYDKDGHVVDVDFIPTPAVEVVEGEVVDDDDESQ